MGIWWNKRTKSYHYEFQHLRRRYTGSGHKRKRDAEKAKATHRKKVISQRQVPKDGGFRQVASIYLDYCERKFVPRTVQYKALVFRKFKKYHGDTKMDHITPALVHDYLNATCPTNQNYNTHRKELSSLFSFARKQLKVISYNPIWDLDPMPVEEAEKEVPTEKEVLKIVAAADPVDEKPLILVILHTLARVDEALRLQWSDVNFEKRFVILKTRKHKKGAWRKDKVYMNDDLHAVLMGLWKKKRQMVWVFYNLETRTRYMRRQKFMKSVCARAFEPGVKVKDYKGPVYGFHALRHFVGSYLDDTEKIGTKTVSKLLRHQQVATTERYLHSLGAAEMMALKKLEGRFDN